MKNGNHCLFKCWEHQEVFDAATEWIQSGFKSKDASWDFESGRSWIDGQCYPGAVYFKDDQDYVVFKIKFPELCL